MPRYNMEKYENPKTSGEKCVSRILSFPAIENFALFLFFCIVWTLIVGDIPKYGAYLVFGCALIFFLIHLFQSMVLAIYELVIDNWGLLTRMHSPKKMYDHAKKSHVKTVGYYGMVFIVIFTLWVVLELFLLVMHLIWYFLTQ